MNTIFALCCFTLIPATMALNCYVCTGAISSSCNDPFSATGSGVNTTGSVSSFTYCMKVSAAGVVTRSGISACANVPYVLNTGTTCCQTDLCNDAQRPYKKPILMAISLLISLLGIQYA